MELPPEEREYLVQRKREVTDELERLSAQPGSPGYIDKTQRRQELLDELDEITEAMGDTLEPAPPPGAPPPSGPSKIPPLRDASGNHLA
ncbi:MAG: hypothetical protein AMXMBFR13_44290 [Phycisphaerae bacterium]|jgi:hypothetical protein